MATTFETRCLNMVNIINAVIKKLQLPGTGQLICVGGVIRTSCGRRGTPLLGRGFRILRPVAQQVWPATQIVSRPHSTVDCTLLPLTDV